jgi:hypothetical protein
MKYLLLRFLAGVLIFSLTISAEFLVYRKVERRTQHRATHLILVIKRFINEKGKFDYDLGSCTATAIGPHTLLTAGHCDDYHVDKIYLDETYLPFVVTDKATSYQITKKIFDGQDHMLLDIAGVYFPYYVTLHSAVRVPHQEEGFYYWGAPNATMNQYREGYFMGESPYNESDKSNDEDEQPIRVRGPLYLTAGSSIPGDSGSAIYSQFDGHLVGIVSISYSETVFGTFPIQFTKAQIQEALQ